MQMKYWICVFLLILLATVHGAFEAAGSLTILKNAQMAGNFEVAKQVSAECCEEETIEISVVGFHCPLDGKILGCGIEITPRTNAQVHVHGQVIRLSSVSGTAFFRPPIS